MIPCILGLGCKVPAILSTRILETERERIIASTLILMATPCLPQTAMVISIMSPYGGKYLILIFGTILAISVFSTYLLNSLLKGETPELFVEIPPYRIPRLSVLFNKLYMRLNSFISEAIPLIMLGVALLSLIDFFGITQSASNFLGKPFLPILGLPPQVLPVVVTGFLRKDVSIALLRPFFLPPEQLAIACIFLILYSPCISTIFVMIKELGVKKALQIIGIMLIMSLSVGGVLNLLFRIL
jgi:ferrous iron transport protein B